MRTAFTHVNDGFWNMLNAIYAIMLREVRCRFAGDPMGYAWAFAVPLLWIGTLLAFFTLVNRTPVIAVDTPGFIATGVIPYVLFRYTISSMNRVVSTHQHLVYFGRIRLSDIMFAGAFLEFLNACIVSLFIWIAIAVLFAPIQIHDPISAANGLVLTALVATSFGRLATFLGLISETVKRIVPVVLRPMFWISGVFFTATELPPSLLTYLWWNPLLHTVEMIRDGVFVDYTSSFAEPHVPVFMSLGFLLLSYLVQDLAGRSRDGRDLG